MEKKPQRVSREPRYGDRPTVTIHAPTHRPSWKRYGEGVANFNAVFNSGDKSISFVVSETALASWVMEEKRDVTKEVYFTADEEGARALYEMLHAHFGKKE